MKKCKEPGCNKPVHKLNLSRCTEHQKKYRAEYYRNNKEKFKPNNSYKYDQETIKKELKGIVPIHGGIYQGCTKSQIEALQSGNAEKLRRLKNE